MKSDFSTSDIYKDALDNLSKKRGQADNASRGAFAGLGERGSAAYDALSNEAYVNKALTDRAFGTAGDRMATIKQRRESNLWNTLGKNERQRRNFEQSVDLAIKNYETREKADEAITTAQYGAAEAAAHVSQSNFDKQLGLKRQQLELDKQNSEFEHAFKLLSDRKLNEKGFQDITGIKVKKKLRPKRIDNNAVITSDVKRTDLGEGYTEYVSHDENFKPIYHYVKKALADKIEEKGIDVVGSDGKFKSTTQLFMEVYGFDRNTENYTEVFGSMEADKEGFIKAFGETTYLVLTNYVYLKSGYILFKDTQYYNNMAVVDDLIDHADYYIATEGEEKYYSRLSFSMNNAAEFYTGQFDAVMPAIRDYYYDSEDQISFSWLQENYTDLASQFQYTDSVEDERRKLLDLPPESFDMSNFAGQLNLPSWYQPPEEWDAESVSNLFNTSAQHEQWQKVLGENYDALWTDHMPTVDELKAKGYAYAAENGESLGITGKEITEESAISLGILAYSDELIAMNEDIQSNTDDETKEINGVGYTWNPNEGVKNSWFYDEDAKWNLNIATALDIKDQANEAIGNILYKKYAGEPVPDADYALLEKFGMTDIVQYLKGMEVVDYNDLPVGTRDLMKQGIMTEGHYQFFDFTAEEMEFLKTATVEMIDQRIVEESAKAQPDDQMLDALNLYRYCKNDLGLEVTGDYEADLAAAKKIFTDMLCDMTGMDSIDEVYSEYADYYEEPQWSMMSGEKTEVPEAWQTANQILLDAPPELFLNTAEETQETYENGAFVAGIRNGITLGLATLQKENVVDPEEFKRMALLGTPVGGTEFYRNGRFYNPGIAEEDAIMAEHNRWAYVIGNIVGSLPVTFATGGLAGAGARALGVTSEAAIKAISAAAPAMVRGGANAAAQGGDLWDIIAGAVTDGAFAAVSFGALGNAASSAVGKLLVNAPALLQRTLPILTEATATAIADTGLNILSDVVMSRDIDWGQTFANMGVDFLFSMFLSGKSGDTYIDPATGKNIEIPAGKTLADIDPEADSFYKALGDTKVTGELDSAVGDIFMQYMDIPESVVSNKEFTPMETAYRKYEANPTVGNAAAYLEEASKIYDLPGVTQYTFDPKATMNSAIDDAYNARMHSMLDEASATGKTPGEYAQSKGVASTLTDADATAGLTMKIDGDGNGGYNGGQGSTLTVEQLAAKPKYSPEPLKWHTKGGQIEIDETGTWIYHDWEDNAVRYPDGYPDFREAGLVIQEVRIDEFEGYSKDFAKADGLAPNGPKSDSSTWHHNQDGITMQEIKTKIHKRFTHRGGMALTRN